MNIIAIIPARMGSSRFPGKPLADIHGIPMVGHVTIRTAMCKELSSTWIATCDQVVMDYAASAGLKAVMTADTHVRCTTRTAEAMLKIEEMTGQRADIVVMVQGDEPMITPDMIDAAVEPMLKDPSINVVNLMADLATEEEFEDPNEVKVVTDLNGDALYFSREPIPSRRKGTPHVPMHKQVCIIPSTALPSSSQTFRLVGRPHGGFPPFYSHQPAFSEPSGGRRCAPPFIIHP